MRNQGIGSWPRRRARMVPDLAAVVHAERTETFGSLMRRVDRLANALRQLGVTRGDRVAYLGPNHPAFVEALFAATSLGAVFVPLNSRLAAPELAYLLSDSGARILFCAPESEVLCDDAVGLLIDNPIEVVTRSGRAGPDYESLISGASGDPTDEPVTLDDVALIMYTSGTTGRPKGAILTHGNLTWNTYNLLVDLDLTGHEVTLVSAPLFHTAALSQTFLPTFLKGGSSVLTTSFDSEGVFDLIETYAVTYMFGVPTMFQAMASSSRWDGADLSSLRLLHCGGAPVPEALIRTYQERGLTFTEGYGLTEASPGVLLLRADQSTRKLGAAGVACFFSDVQIVDGSGEPATPGEAGEIVVSGPNVMQGYWQQPAATAATMGDDGWLHTGDVGVADDDGYVTVVDRLKDLFISGGENVYPAEVEAALSAHPGVEDCAVIPIPHPKWGEVGRAVLVLRRGDVVDTEEVRRFLDGRLARYKIPADSVVTDSLPRNPAGKLVRARIRELYGSAA